MNILKKLFSLPRSKPHFYGFSVRCKRGGEIVAGQDDRSIDPSPKFGEYNQPDYVCREVLIGSGRCFQSIETLFKIDDHRRLLVRQVTGGEFVEG